MYKNIVLIVILLPGMKVVAMEQAHSICLVNESSHSEPLVKLLLTDWSYQPTHEVSLPLSHARMLGAISDLLEHSELRETVFPLPEVRLDQWLLIATQLESVCRIVHDDVTSEHVKKEIKASYEKLDALVLIELIRALDYLDIPLLLVIACEVVEQDGFNRCTLEQVLSLPEGMRNRIILQKLLTSYGPIPLPTYAVGKGHEGRVSSVRATSDGKIVTASYDKTVRVYDVHGKELAVCRGHEGEVQSACITRDGKIVSCSEDTTVRIWDMAGNELSVCRGHEGRVWSVALMNDGTIVSGSRDKTVRVWDENGKERAVCRGHNGDVGQVCATDDGTIVSSSQDKTVRLWNRKGKALAVCTGHEDRVNAICLTPQGKIVSCSDDKTVRVWDMNGSQLAVCRGHAHWIESVCVTNNNMIVSGSRDKTVRVWDMNGKERASCRVRDGGILSVCVTSDGKIVSGCEAGTVSVWDMNGKELAFGRGHDGEVWSVCVTHDSKIISGFDQGAVRVWDFSLLDRINLMDGDRAQAQGKLLERSSRQEGIDKKDLWKEIEEFFGEHSLVKIYVTDPQSYEISHGVVLPIRFAHLIGAISDSVDNPAFRDTGFSLLNVTLSQWGLIEAQLERLYGIVQNLPEGGKVREAILEDYKKLDAHCVIELIKSLDCLVVPVLRAIAFDVVVQDTSDRFTYEHVLLLSEATANRIILHKLLSAFGPVPARKRVVCRGHDSQILLVGVTSDDKIVASCLDQSLRVWDIQGKQHAVFRKGFEGIIMYTGLPNDNKMVMDLPGRSLWVYDIQGKKLARLEGETVSFSSISVTNSGMIVIGCNDGTFCMWDISLLDRIQSMDRCHAQAVWKYMHNYHNLRGEKTQWEKLKKHRGLRDQLQLRKDSRKDWKAIEKILGENTPE